MTLIEKGYWQRTKEALRISKKKEDIDEFRDRLIGSLLKVTSNNSDFLNYYAKAIEYSQRTGDLRPLRIWNVANTCFQMLIVENSNYIRKTEDILLRGLESLRNLELNIQKTKLLTSNRGNPEIDYIPNENVEVIPEKELESIVDSQGNGHK